MTKVADRIASDLKSIDTTDTDYYTTQRAAFTTALAPYTSRSTAAIKAKFAGQKVAATESIFEYMATALSLVLVSPPEFMKAVAEGNDPPTLVAAFQQAITTKEATVLVYNVQTSTDVTNTIKQMATQQGIPVVAVSETLQPPDATFQEWQLGQLNTLYNALNAKALAK